MKKLPLSFLLSCLICCIAYSQDTLKVSQGHFTTELNINPFKGELSLNNALNQIKARYFIANNVALRIALNFNSKKTSTDNSSVYGSNPINTKTSQKTTAVGLNFGFEKHFKGTRRLSPYLGAEFVLGSKSASQTLTSGNTETKIDGAWQTYTIIPGNNGGYSIDYTEKAYFQYGFNLLGGFDFYVAKHFYMGYEIAFGLSQTNYKDISVTSKPNSGFVSPDYSQKDFSFGATLINGIRVGFVF